MVVSSHAGYFYVDKKGKMIDSKLNKKEGSFNVVFTSNKVPALWKENFEEDDALLCALDRIFDDTIVFNIRG